MQTFFLAMVGCPEVQEKAHKELDAVVGSRRLPTFEDLTSLPYVTAIMYDGYFIPKGTVVIANIWYTC